MSYWSCAQLEANHERLALHCLEFGGFTTYPRERRRISGRRITATQPLFPGYAFVRSSYSGTPRAGVRVSRA